MPIDFRYVPPAPEAIDGIDFIEQTERAINELGGMYDEVTILAGEALSTANSALSTTNNALATAEDASANAQNALDGVNALNTRVDTVDMTASSALARANDAYDLAAVADSGASAAQSAAMAAQTSANVAQTTANAAAETAEQANLAADIAKYSADTAQNTADTAMGVYTVVDEAVNADDFQEAGKFYITSEISTNFPCESPLYFTVGATDDATGAIQWARSETDFTEYCRTGTIISETEVDWEDWQPSSGVACDSLVTVVTEPRPLCDKLRDVISVKDFGAKGIYPSDDSEAIIAADAHCAATGKHLFFPAGQYGISKSITQNANWYGVGAPKLAPFPMVGDDKDFLRPGYKDKMPGSSIFLLAGAQLDSVSTVRSDMFATMQYAIKTRERPGISIRGMALIMDMDALDSFGDITTPETDRRAACEVGYLIDDADRSEYTDFNVFGYWDKAGIVIWSHYVGDNPDYCKFFGGSTMGYYALALIGYDGPAGPGPGLSGTQGFGFQLFGNDHHSRLPQPKIDYQTNAYGHCLFVDGATMGQITDLNGHEFVGGGFRTLSNRPIVLDHCSNLHLTSVPFEFSQRSDQEDTLNTKFIGTENTRSVYFVSCRNLSPAFLFHNEFGDIISWLTVIDEQATNSGLIHGGKGNFALVRGANTLDNFTPMLEFTSNPMTITQSGFLRRDIPSGCLQATKFGFRQGGILTVADESITVTDSYHGLMGPIVGTSDLYTIEGGGMSGQKLTLFAANQTQNVRLMSGSASKGNIRFANSQNRTLLGVGATITLVYNGSQWVQESVTDLWFETQRPQNDGIVNLGSASFNFKDIYANGQIGVSDERLKMRIADIDDALLDVWEKVNFKQFLFRDAFAKKGEDARIHVGLVVQYIIQVFDANGYDWRRCAAICHDVWEDEYKDVANLVCDAVYDEQGGIISEPIWDTKRVLVKPAGDKYSLRMAECLALEAVCSRRRLNNLEARLDKLEAASTKLG